MRLFINANRMFFLRIAIVAVMLTAVGMRAEAREFGVWTHHNAYSKLTHVVPANGRVYALSDGKLYAYNPSDDSFAEHNVTTTLNSWHGITDICYNSSAKRLVIAYSNGAIDLLSDNGTAKELAAIANESTNNTKSINSIMCLGKKAFLCMKWGVVVVNCERMEIEDTYRIDPNNESITGIYAEGDSIFVEASKNIGDYGSSMIKGITKDNLIDRTKWVAVDAARKAAISQSIRSSLQSRNIYIIGNSEKKCSEMIEDRSNHCYWGSNDNNLLTKYTKREDGSYADASTPKKPYGPSSGNIYTLRWGNGGLYCTGEGWHTKTPTPADPVGMVQHMNLDGRWNRFEQPTEQQIGHTYQMCSDVAIDPRDTAHVMVGARNGLYEFVSGKFVKHYNSLNSPIKALGDGTSLNYQMILGHAYDSNGALWLLNSYCSRALLKLNQASPRDISEAGNKWETFQSHKEIDRFTPNERYLCSPFFDSKGNLWFINTNYFEASYYRYTPQSDILKEFTPDKNQDDTKLYNTEGDGWIRCIAEDKEGNVWIGGTKGVAYLPAESIETATNQVTQPKISRDDATGMADYLLATVDATSILFDGANRMYVATLGNGIYVISADRQKEDQHYHTGNCQIASDNVTSLALDEKTGTLYAATDMGLCSVTTNAIEVPETLEEDNVKVYPNPVTPEYNGPITIEGLPLGADIKITTATGRVVHHGRSDSAIYQWDGRDDQGERCASGVYNILLTDSEGDKGCVAKIGMVR